MYIYIFLLQFPTTFLQIFLTVILNPYKTSFVFLL